MIIMKKVKCEGLCNDCQTHYSDARVTMAEIKSELSHIRETLELNQEQHQEILSTLKEFKKELDSKASKSEVKEINKKLWSFIISFTGILLGITAYFIVKWMESH